MHLSSKITIFFFFFLSVCLPVLGVCYFDIEMLAAFVDIGSSVG